MSQGVTQIRRIPAEDEPTHGRISSSNGGAAEVFTTLKAQGEFQRKIVWTVAISADVDTDWVVSIK